MGIDEGTQMSVAPSLPPSPRPAEFGRGRRVCFMGIFSGTSGRTPACASRLITARHKRQSEREICFKLVLRGRKTHWARSLCLRQGAASVACTCRLRPTAAIASSIGQLVALTL